MMPDVLSRVIITVVVVILAVAGYYLVNYVQIQRLQRQRIAVSPARRPVLLYFTTPTCAPCKAVQRPAIQRVQTELGERLEVIEIDASANPEEARRWGVLSVPTTILLDQEGKARRINNGVTAAARLLSQVNEVLE